MAGRTRITAITGVLGAAVASLIVLGTPGGAAAAAPANDEIAHATRITTLPATFSVDTTEATSTRSDGRCVRGASVWFRFRPSTSTTLRLTTLGSDFDTLLAVFVGTRANHRFLKCSDDGIGLASATRVRAEPETTYWIAVSSCCSRRAPGGAARLNTAVTFPPPDGQVTVTAAESGGVSGGLLVSGTATCAAIAGASIDLFARQRVDAGVARGGNGVEDFTCFPDQVATWEVYIDSETGWAFQPDKPVRIEGEWSMFDGFNGMSDTFDLVLTTSDNPNAKR